MVKQTLKETEYNPTKQKILTCAAEIFLEQGYHGTTTRLIAARANVNNALINYHFRDKETLYLEVARYWANHALRDYPFVRLKDPTVTPEEKIQSFIHHTLLCLFGSDGRGTGFGRLLAREAAVNPSEVILEIISETIAPPTKALSGAIEELCGSLPADKLRIYTTCIVGQTVYLFLSRNFTNELLGLPPIRSEEDIIALSQELTRFSLAALQKLRENEAFPYQT